jgi:predicted MPP superfamily phosphohydrolase
MKLFCSFTLSRSKALGNNLKSRLIFVISSAVIISNVYGQNVKASDPINILFTSDAHYGIFRKSFRSDTNVVGHIVNAAMIRQMNTMPQLTLPADSGVNAGRKIQDIDYLVQTGDIANRMEIPIQSARVSWNEFQTDYFDGLKLKGHNGKPTQLLLIPGNHDISDAIGYYKPMKPLTDPTSMVNIYNLMVKPSVPLSNETYNYNIDKVNYSRNIGGVHFVFITLWPDSAERIWMKKDLDTVPQKTPVILFTHDQPICEAVHFTNPVAPYQIIPGKPFENLLAEHYKEGDVADKKTTSTDIEQREWVVFLKRYPNIKAYFHGNSNYNEYYTYDGPDHDVALKVFRVDSPMKGKYSSKDETLLSYQLISLDPETKKLTVRECLWDTQPQNPSAKVIFGKTVTIDLH